ncbi:MAG: UDP-3-O-(3-hydroxymyristoyl)glucosamine N-acyltransferase [candidate division WOR-3 bacterium]
MAQESIKPLIACIDKSAKIAQDAQISPFVYIGKNVKIGAKTKIQPFVAIFDNCEIGKRVVIGSGTIIGSSGFGYKKNKGKYERIPHKGKVVIEDDVEIGQNVTIDRAKVNETRIGKGTKIDSLVHIGHNVKIGKNCIIIAQCGIAGSVKLGNNVILAGQVGIKDHLTIGDNAIIYAKSAVFKNVPKNGKYSGIPARPHNQTLKAWAKLYADKCLP